ncbi:MAG: hypothetical protein A2038_11975 [Deltaproteobacteria bacterium GWA2_57_13]|nr:MAG: hypothetical protein A2038_11975 [Deltaproteobacteria bacterium GWA2_57_13]OGQ80256.1 MAG: hypothetical protein A3G40_13705 [Deltaproteobacteria bacterium RIFCSPLOWO2_12_FULL_57_22]
MPKDPFKETCFMCGSEFRMGAGIYNGHYIRRYQISACKACWAGNWDGWHPHYEARLIEHLKAKRIPVPKRNAKDLLPRE